MEELLAEKKTSITRKQRISREWGIWGKEKYTYSEWKQNEKHHRELSRLNSLLSNAPSRMELALHYTYGLCDLNGYSSPITENEFSVLMEVYNKAEAYVCDCDNKGLKFLIKELYYIHSTAAAIPGFSSNLVNESNDLKIWRKYVHLDFFKFSLINQIIRIPIEEILSMEDDELVASLLLSQFLGIGSFLEKSKSNFTQETWDSLNLMLSQCCESLEISLEFPSIDKTLIGSHFGELLTFVSQRRTISYPYDVQRSRFNDIFLCNQYYKAYYERHDGHVVPEACCSPFESIRKIRSSLKSAIAEEFDTLKIQLQQARSHALVKFGPAFTRDLNVKDYAKHANHPWFQWILLECEVLGRLYELETGSCDGRIIFEELIPFYAVSIGREWEDFFQMPTNASSVLPKIILAHHVHNANPDITYRKMIINRNICWDPSKCGFNLSSSSSHPDIVKAERSNCLRSGFDYYRLHARQHLKAGNQNRAVFNAIDQQGHEYYLTMDDDFFCFPDFPLIAHGRILKDDLDFYQSVNAYSAMYSNCSVAERADAELMFNFESTFGYPVPRLFSFPRGTSTVFSFVNGKNSLADTGGFLLDFSCEDFGQGCLSLIQRDTSVYGSARYVKQPGEVSTKIHCIGEGVDLNGKMRQIDRWSHGSGKVLFHLMIPALFKSMAQGEFDLLNNRQFVGTYLVYCSSFISRLSTMMFVLVPFLVGNLTGWFASSMNTSFTHVELLLAMAALNFAMFTVQIFSVQSRVSWSPLRIFLLDLIVNLSSLLGFIKGLLGFTPKSWAAHKSRKYNISIFFCTYLLIFALVTAVCIDSFIGSTLHLFWTTFLLCSMVAAIIVLPKKIHRTKSITHFAPAFWRNLWAAILATNILVTCAFFYSEGSVATSGLKIFLLIFLAIVAAHNLLISWFHWWILRKQTML